MFQRGDIVKYIDIMYFTNVLTLGRSYMVVDIETNQFSHYQLNSVMLMDDKGTYLWFPAWHFELNIKMMRKRKILRCLV